MTSSPEVHTALVEVGRALQAARYTFATVTPATQLRNESRRLRSGYIARDLRDVFGWNWPFSPALLESRLLSCLEAAGAVQVDGDRLRSRVRFATLRGKLFAHSGFPTDEADAVFFGPDTVRFCALVERWAPARVGTLVDVGCGSGAGGICAAGLSERLVLADIGPRALDFARVNLELNGAVAQVVQSDVLADVPGEIELAIANPPYLRDSAGRLYRDGGGAFGEALAVRIVEQTLARLAPGGTLVLYTGSAIVEGVDTFFQAVEPLLHGAGVSFAYEELDPDVFGEELEQPAYRDAERLAAVGLRLWRAA
jgi:release factor glutamine methyltransferase